MLAPVVALAVVLAGKLVQPPTCWEFSIKKTRNERHKEVTSGAASDDIMGGAEPSRGVQPSASIDLALLGARKK